jgi:prevent-host-death family protein
MRYSSQVKPINYLKASAAEVLTHLAEQREPLVITQNGETKAILQDVASFEETQETLALLKILALGNQDLVAGQGYACGRHRCLPSHQATCYLMACSSARLRVLKKRAAQSHLSSRTGPTTDFPDARLQQILTHRCLHRDSFATRAAIGTFARRVEIAGRPRAASDPVPPRVPNAAHAQVAPPPGSRAARFP